MQTEKNLSLWQLTNEHQKLISELYDPETGEVNEIVQAKLDQLEPNVEKKCIAVTKWIKKLESYERELDELIARKDAYRREIEKYQNYLQVNMEKSGIKEISCPYFSLKLRKNPYSTDIISQELIPSEYIKVKEVVRVITSVDKNAIKEEVLKTGHQVPGAYVSQKNKLVITTDKL